MDPSNESVGAPSPAPEVWPPPPTSFAAVTETSTSPLAAVEGFRVQSYWGVFFLTVITLGIYEVFWLKRTIRAIAVLRPSLKLTQVYANVVLAFALLSAGLDIATWIRDSPSLDSAATGLDRVFGIMLLVLLLQVRNGFNMMLQLRKPDPYWFSGFYTWFFGAAYLQYKINRNIRRWQTEPRPTEA